jgi:hypothetical protein
MTFGFSILPHVSVRLAGPALAESDTNRPVPQYLVTHVLTHLSRIAALATSSLGIDRRLKIQNLASASIEGDSKHPVFNGLFQSSF